jgi:NADPH2:quinone reductase
MRAAVVDQPGPPESLRVAEVPDPVPGPGQVRVRVHAASVNPIDTYYRNGLVKAELPTPFIPGADFAGVVDAVGTGSRFRVGQAVWGSNQGLLGRQGTLAERCVADDHFAYHLPGGVEFGTAAAAALVGITAHLGLFWRARLQPGEAVFVNGGTGGVGSMVVQMARAVGAEVIATAGTAEKCDQLRRWGATAVNYKSDDLAAVVMANTPGGRGVDVWFETQPPTDLDRTVELTAPNGRLVLMAGRASRPAFPNGPFYTKGLTAHGFAMFNVAPPVQAEAAGELGLWLVSGQVRPIVGAVFPLAEAAAAHRLQEDNTLGKAGTLTGKVVVRVVPEAV